MSAVAVAALGHRGLGRCGRSGEDGNVGAAGFVEYAVHDSGASFGVSEGGGDAENFKLGTFEGKGKREGIVDVVAYVGIDDDFFARSRCLGRLLCLR